MNNALIIKNVDDVQRVAKAMATSGYFADAKEASQAAVKIMAGHEMGVGAFAAMTGIHVIKGKPILGANLIASKIKNDPRYDYRIVKFTDTECSIDFYENNKKIGESAFTMADAKKAGLVNNNWTKYPRNMLFARTISNGAKWYTPGIFGGAPVYTPDEFGLDVDSEGDVIVEVVDKPALPSGSDPAWEMDREPEKVTTVTGEDNRPWNAEQVKGYIGARAKHYLAMKYKYLDPNKTRKGAMAGNLNELLCNETNRHAVLVYLTGKASINDIKDAGLLAIKDWLNMTQDENDNWGVGEFVKQEAATVLKATMKDQGQEELL